MPSTPNPIRCSQSHAGDLGRRRRSVSLTAELHLASDRQRGVGLRGARLSVLISLNKIVLAPAVSLHNLSASVAAAASTTPKRKIGGFEDPVVNLVKANCTHPFCTAAAADK